MPAAVSSRAAAISFSGNVLNYGVVVSTALSITRTIRMLTTRFTQLVGCTIPLQQAAIGGLSNPRLAAAVANAGGLGMVSVYGKSPDGIVATFDALRGLTSGVFGANFIMRFVDPAQAGRCIAAAAARARVVEFFYSDPDPALVEMAHQG